MLHGNLPRVSIVPMSPFWVKTCHGTPCARASLDPRLPHDRPPEFLLALDEGLGLCWRHDLHLRAQFIKAVIDTRHLEHTTKALIQPSHNVLGRSCRSGETHPAHSRETRHGLGDSWQIGKGGIALRRHHGNELEV